jgi:hypothetical protein
MSYALELAFKVALGYVAFSWLCGGLWVAVVEFAQALMARPQAYQPE